MSGSNNSSTGGYIVDRAPLPASGDAVTAAMQTMIAQLAQLPGNMVRPRWQPMPPTQPAVDQTWAAVGVIRTEADAFPYIAHDGATTLPGETAPGVDRMQRHSTVTVLATFYGPNADDAAVSVRDALYVPQNMEPLAPLGLKLLEVHDLTRAPEIMNQQFVDRVDLRIDMRRQINRVYPIFDLNAARVRLINEKFETDVSVDPPP